jgi:hypothetical protein
MCKPCLPASSVAWGGVGPNFCSLLRVGIQKLIKIHDENKSVKHNKIENKFITIVRIGTGKILP